MSNSSASTYEVHTKKGTPQRVAIWVFVKEAGLSSRATTDVVVGEGHTTFLLVA